MFFGKEECMFILNYKQCIVKAEKQKTEKFQTSLKNGNDTQVK